MVEGARGIPRERLLSFSSVELKREMGVLLLILVLTRRMLVAFRARAGLCFSIGVDLIASDDVVLQAGVVRIGEVEHLRSVLDEARRSLVCSTRQAFGIA
jgi:hypothetical protein